MHKHDCKRMSVLFITSVILCTTATIQAKPTSPSPAVSNLGPSRRIPAESNSEPRGTLGPKSTDGTWEASARLRASTETGGNENSRYNIRRDGSLSVALNSSPGSSSQNHNPTFEWIRNDRKISPTEVRSFSVVLSDVDVVGRYPGGSESNHPDAFSEAGVTGYQVHSNTIHRMNASWKLNPRRSRLSPEELLTYLSYFSNKEQPTESQQQQQRNYKAEKTLLLNVSLAKVNGDDDANLPPFTTWSNNDDDDKDESTTQKSKLLFFNESADDSNSNRRVDRSNIIAADENNGTNHIVLHDLIATLEKLIETTTRSENSSETDAADQPPEHEFEFKLKNGTRTRMSATDPQQTASDLKKLMSLLLKSTDDAHKESDAASGAQVVNVVITPNTNTAGGSNSTRQDERQKILFLKSPQVKHLLDTALSDPTLNFAAQKIAAALHTPQYEDSDDGGISGSMSMPSSSHVSGIPDGFPLNATGFLNLQHPNLQFHQALHHLVSNGSAPSSINASTKTNVINIFVLNFNSQPGISSSGGSGSSNSDNVESSSPVRLKPPVIYSSGNDQKKPANFLTSNGGPAESSAPPLIFFNKLGLPVLELEDQKDKPVSPDEANISSAFKPFIEVTASHGHPYVAVTHNPPTLSPTRPTSTTIEATNGKINILDLLPGNLNSFTKVEVEDGNEKLPPVDLPTPQINNTESPITNEKLENDAMELLSYFANPDHSVNPIDGGKPAFPEDLSPLSWILKQQPPPKPFVTKPFSKLSKLNSEDEDSSSDEYIDESTEGSVSGPWPVNPSIDKRIGMPMFDNSATKLDKAETTTKQGITPNEDNRPLYEQVLTTTTRNSTKSLNFKKNKTRKGVSKKNQPATQIQNQTSISPPVPTPIAAPAPVAISPDTPDNVKIRLRKLITALGYSAIPTIAAGAVASWPYWVPIVAASAGRQSRRRRRRDAPLDFDLDSRNSTNPEALKSIIIDKDKDQVPSQSQSIVPVEKLEEQQALQIPPSQSQWENSNLSSPSIQLEFKKETSTRDVKANKAGEPIESDPKWIKVEVITESSPTSSSSLRLRSSTGHQNSTTTIIAPTDADDHAEEDNNRQFVNGEPQDVPLLKNFLKNVLSNEWNISTTTPSSYASPSHSYSYSKATTTTTTSPPSLLLLSPLNMHSHAQILQTIQKHQLTNTNTNSPPSFTPNKEFTNHLKLNTNQAQQSSPTAPLMSSVKYETFLPPGSSAINLLLGPKWQIPIKESAVAEFDLQQKINEKKMKKIAASIQAANKAYASAALFPIWFPILFSKGINMSGLTDRNSMQKTDITTKSNI